MRTAAEESGPQDYKFSSTTFGHFFCHNRPGIRVFESLLDNQRESALFVVPEES